MTLIDTMEADATTRLNLWVARSAGQHKRALHHEPEPVAPVSHYYEAGNVITFAGAEPEQADGMAIFGRCLGWMAFAVLVTLSWSRWLGFGRRFNYFCKVAKIMYYSFVNVLTTQDKPDPLMAGFQPRNRWCREHLRAIAIKGFLLSVTVRSTIVSGRKWGRPSQNRDTVMLAAMLAGATPITRGTGRIDKSGVLETSMSIRFGGVKPLLLNLGRGGLWVKSPCN